MDGTQTYNTASTVFSNIITIESVIVIYSVLGKSFETSLACQLLVVGVVVAHLLLLFYMCGILDQAHITSIYHTTKFNMPPKKLTQADVDSLGFGGLVSYFLSLVPYNLFTVAIAAVSYTTTIPSSN